ncbi:M20 family metallopeptidase [uncultured Vagococcus sp.]|uniref:M20 metallopeptidase family protein n=1 Tax=uncultured Vagococcus sp. TaxID=189676 RepID=UPI0028D8825C|nr:M20 family metallopeptidase [uncultured Vagococcus sp.]
MTLIKNRMALHRIPELGFQEFKTKAYLLNEVVDYDCRIHHVGETGLVLYFDNRQPDTIAFRTDIDALPIKEDTELSFQSQHPGYMHACGHDGHMAMVLELAAYLNQHKHQLPHNVVLIFQPSEEISGGAQSIVDSGLLETYDVQAIFGFHLWPGLASGDVFSRKGGMMAQSSETDIIVKGKSAHIASHEQGIDALEIGVRLMTDIYDFDQTVPAEEYHLLKFGEIHGGTIRNVLGEMVTISGSIRSYSDATQTYFKDTLNQLAEPYRKTRGCQIEFKYNDGYPAVINDEALFNQVRKVLPNLNELSLPVLQAEDFGVYTQHYPCVFFFLGVGEVPPLHNPKFDFDMSLLTVGVETYRQLLDIKLK